MPKVDDLITLDRCGIKTSVWITLISTSIEQELFIVKDGFFVLWRKKQKQKAFAVHKREKRKDCDEMARGRERGKLRGDVLIRCYSSSVRRLFPSKLSNGWLNPGNGTRWLAEVVEEVVEGRVFMDEGMGDSSVVWFGFWHVSILDAGIRALGGVRCEMVVP